MLIKCSLFLLVATLLLPCASVIFAEPPSIDNDFLSHLKDDTIQTDKVKVEHTFKENLTQLFYPSTVNDSFL
ncbi:MAG: hypothetical protein LBG52_03355 [Candidatus Peribacteria bacterium]|jgi:hypothetical protein|nr:hypothetical protein [Candidatus Peribacteria bacterium]